MKKMFTLFLMVIVTGIIVSNYVGAQSQTSIFGDELNTNGLLNPNIWVPIVKNTGDILNLGRTQFMYETFYSYNGGAPNGGVWLSARRYNPSDTTYFKGAAIKTKDDLALVNGLGTDVHVGSRTQQTDLSLDSGNVFKIILAGSVGVDTFAISFDLLTNRPFEVLTNVFTKGTESPQFCDLPLRYGFLKTDIREYLRDYEFKFSPDGSRLDFIIDGNIIRTVWLSGFSAGMSMSLYMVMYVPGTEFPLAYSASIWPVGPGKLNTSYGAYVDYVRAYTFSDVATGQFEEKLLEVSFYPNPASNAIYFSDSEEKMVRISNIAGVVLLSQKAFNYLLVENLPKGVYSVEIEQKGVRFYKKLIKL